MHKNPSNELTWSLWTLIGIAVLFSISCLALIIARIFFKKVLRKYCSCCPCYAIRKDFTTLREVPSNGKRTLRTNIHQGTRSERDVQPRKQERKTVRKTGSKTFPYVIVTEPSGKHQRPTTTIVTLPGARRLTGIHYNKVIPHTSSTDVTSQTSQLTVPKKEGRRKSQNQNVPVVPEVARKRWPAPVWSTPQGNKRTASLPSITTISDFDKAPSTSTSTNREQDITTSSKLDLATPQDAKEVQDKVKSNLKNPQIKRQITQPVSSVSLRKSSKEIKKENSKDLKSDSRLKTSPQDANTRHVEQPCNLTDSEVRKVQISESAITVLQEKEIKSTFPETLADSHVEEHISQLLNTSNQPMPDGMLVRANLAEPSGRTRHAARAHPTFPQTTNDNPPSPNTNTADNSNAAGNNAVPEPADLSNPMEVRRLLLETGNLPDNQVAHRANVRLFDWSMDLLGISQRPPLEEDPATNNEQAPDNEGR